MWEITKENFMENQNERDEIEIDLVELFYVCLLYTSRCV